MMIGRIGDIINGEHVATLTSLPWGVIYAHPASPSNWQHGLAASHPAVVYEMLWNLGVLGIVWPLRNRLRPYGMLFALYLALYSIGKFLISFLRIGAGSMDKEWVWSMGEAHFIALAVLLITVPVLLYKAQLVQPPSRPRRPRGGRDAGGRRPVLAGGARLAPILRLAKTPLQFILERAGLRVICPPSSLLRRSPLPGRHAFRPPCLSAALPCRSPPAGCRSQIQRRWGTRFRPPWGLSPLCRPRGP